jgi:hypothetical protein
MEEVDFEEKRKKLDVMMFSEDEENIYEIAKYNFSPGPSNGGNPMANGSSLITKRALPPVEEDAIIHKAKPEFNKDLVVFSKELMEKNRRKEIEERERRKRRKLKEKKRKEKEAKTNGSKSSQENEPKKLEGLALVRFNMEQEEKKKKEKLESQKKNKTAAKTNKSQETLIQ